MEVFGKCNTRCIILGLWRPSLLLYMGLSFHPGHLCMQPIICWPKEPMFGEDQRHPGELGFELGRAWAAGCLGGAF